MVSYPHLENEHASEERLYILRLRASLLLDGRTERPLSTFSYGAIQNLEAKYFVHNLELSRLSAEEQDLSKQLFTSNRPIAITKCIFGCNPHYRGSPPNVQEMLQALYFKANDFSLDLCRDSLIHLLTCCQAVTYMERVGLYAEHLAWLVGVQMPFPLREVNIYVNEVDLVREAVESAEGYQGPLPPPLHIPRTLNRLILRLWRVRRLTMVRIPKVRFTSVDAHLNSTTPDPADVIPGGALATVVAPVMMNLGELRSSLPSKGVTLRHCYRFDFLKLPHKVRNQVYRWVFFNDGPVHPSKLAPTSAYNLQYPDEHRDRWPHSSLAILLVSRTVYAEACEKYYSQNTFVFYYAQQAKEFLDCISEPRRKSIRAIEMWIHEYDDYTEDALANISQLHGLRTLKLVMVGGANDFKRGSDVTADRFEHQFRTLRQKNVQIVFDIRA